MVVEALHAVVANGAVGGARRTEDLAGKAVLQLDGLVADDHLLGPGRRTEGAAVPSGAVGLDLDLALGVPRLVAGGAGNDACKEGFGAFFYLDPSRIFLLLLLRDLIHMR